MPPFNWTGSLRPTMVSPRREVPAGIARPDYAETGIPTAEIESKQQSISAPATTASFRVIFLQCPCRKTKVQHVQKY